MKSTTRTRHQYSASPPHVQGLTEFFRYEDQESANVTVRACHYCGRTHVHHLPYGSQLVYGGEIGAKCGHGRYVVIVARVIDYRESLRSIPAQRVALRRSASRRVAA